MNYTICFSLDFSEFQSSKSLNSCYHFADNCYKMHFVLPCVDFSFCLSKPYKMFVTFLLLRVTAILPSPLCKLTTFTKEKIPSWCASFQDNRKTDCKDLAFCLQMYSQQTFRLNLTFENVASISSLNDGL